MTDTTDGVSFGPLPNWAEQFLERLDADHSVRSERTAARNFPDGRAPRWLRGETRAESSGPPEWLDSFFLDGDRSLRELWVEEGFLSTDPEWLAELVRADRTDVARVFLLTGNVHDYAFSPRQGYLPVVERLQENAVERKDWVIRYSLSNGFERPVRGSATPDSDPSPFSQLGCEEVIGSEDQRTRSAQETVDRDLQIMEQVLNLSYDGGVTLLVDNLHLLAPPDSRNVNQNVLVDAVDRWAQAPEMFQSENQVVLLSESTEALSQDLQSTSSHIATIDVPRPEEPNDRLKFLTAIFAGGRVESMTGVRLDAATRPRFGDGFGDRIVSRLQTLADRTSGLNLVGLENLLLRLNATEDQRLTVDFLKTAKRDLLARESGGLLEVSEPDVTGDRRTAFDHVGGLSGVCEKLLDISELLHRSGNSTVVEQSLPSGLLFLGPPGTGKTLVARAFADASGINFAELGNIRSMYVGESERNLSQALELVRSLTPVVVFVDEIDQTMGQRRDSTDSGVDQRLFARLLQFMSDPELDGRVIWIGASNEPQQIDPALKRAGRFDLTVPFLRPSGAARREILSVHLANRGVRTSLSDDEWERIVAETAGYTGAELESVAKKAIRERLLSDSDASTVTVRFDDLRAAIAAYEPPADRREFRRMEDQALVEVTAVDMLSDKQRERREALIEEGESH